MSSHPPLAPSWKRIVERRVPAYGQLPARLRRRFDINLQVFLSRTPFVGKNDFPISDEVRVTIAATGVLMSLGGGASHLECVREVRACARAHPALTRAARAHVSAFRARARKADERRELPRVCVVCVRFV